MQKIIEGIIYGIIQGLTEFIPISSTAHIRVIPALFHWDDPGAAYTAVIQIGTLIATLVYFRNDIGELIKGFFGALKTRDFITDPYARLSMLIIVGTIPISLFGLTLKKYIEGSFRGLYVVSASLIVFAIVLFIAEKMASKKKDLKDITVWDGIIIGFAQAIALIPGASRSGVTITAGLFSGLKRETAARYSFLLSIPAVALSGVYELFSKRAELLNENAIGLIVSTIVSGVVGYMAIAFLINFLKTRSNLIFIIYRIVLGIIIIVLLSAGVLKNI
ncbi:MAG: undecaprenyl-diphosphate phosphatase [Ignavibacteriae bacterium]|nr:undecaprenyl-diphosphate phosphatase [Ignavibacteriota bacterium]